MFVLNIFTLKHLVIGLIGIYFTFFINIKYGICESSTNIDALNNSISTLQKAEEASASSFYSGLILFSLVTFGWTFVFIGFPILSISPIINTIKHNPIINNENSSVIESVLSDNLHTEILNELDDNFRIMKNELDSVKEQMNELYNDFQINFTNMHTNLSEFRETYVNIINDMKENINSISLKLTEEHERLMFAGKKGLELDDLLENIQKDFMSISNLTHENLLTSRSVEHYFQLLQNNNLDILSRINMLDSKLNSLVTSVGEKSMNIIYSPLEYEHNILYMLVFLSIFVCIFFIIFLFKKKIKMILKTYIDNDNCLMAYGIEGFPLIKDFSLVGFVESLYFPVDICFKIFNFKFISRKSWNFKFLFFFLLKDFVFSKNHKWGYSSVGSSECFASIRSSVQV